jgi:hypothetical protein
MSNVFYCLSKPDSAFGRFAYGDEGWYSAFQSLDWAEGVDFESIRCPKTWKHQRAGSRIGDLKVKIGLQDIGDFMWTLASECLLTETVASAFQRHRFSGFELRPVTVEAETGIDPSEIPSFHELKPTGKGGHAHPSSGIETIYEHKACGLVIYSSFKNGILVDPTQWDGSDFFTVTAYPLFILVTESVKNVISREQFTNCALIPAHSLKWAIPWRPEDLEYEQFD